MEKKIRPPKIEWAKLIYDHQTTGGKPTHTSKRKITPSTKAWESVNPLIKVATQKTNGKWSNMTSARASPKVRQEENKNILTTKGKSSGAIEMAHWGKHMPHCKDPSLDPEHPCNCLSVPQHQESRDGVLRASRLAWLAESVCSGFSWEALSQYTGWLRKMPSISLYLHPHTTQIYMCLHLPHTHENIKMTGIHPYWSVIAQMWMD